MNKNCSVNKIVDLIHKTFNKNEQFNFLDIISEFNFDECDRINLESEFEKIISENICGITIQSGLKFKYRLTCKSVSDTEILKSLLQNSMNLFDIMRDPQTDNIVMSREMDIIIEVVHRKFSINDTFKVADIYEDLWGNDLYKEIALSFKTRIDKCIDGIILLEKKNNTNIYKLMYKKYYF